MSGKTLARFIEENRAELERTETGLRALGLHVVPNFDSNTGEGLETFSSVPCDACETHLAGYRARFATLTADSAKGSV